MSYGLPYEEDFTLHSGWIYNNPIFQPCGVEDDNYDSSDSSSTSPRDSHFSLLEIQSSNTTIMPLIVAEAQRGGGTGRHEGYTRYTLKGKRKKGCSNQMSKQTDCWFDKK